MTITCKLKKLWKVGRCWAEIKLNVKLEQLTMFLSGPVEHGSELYDSHGAIGTKKKAKQFTLAPELLMIITLIFLNAFPCKLFTVDTFMLPCLAGVSLLFSFALFFFFLLSVITLWPLVDSCDKSCICACGSFLFCALVVQVPLRSSAGQEKGDGNQY